MSVRAEAIAAESLRDWLLAQLPTKAAAVNALRAPVLKSALIGAFVITAGMALRISKTGVDSGFVVVALTTGTRTATEVAADINAAVGLSGVASSDTDGRLLLTGAAPTGAMQSIAVGLDTTGANAVFGWDNGGHKAVRYPITAPRANGIADGWPVGAVPDMGPGFWLIIGDRESVPVAPDIRRDEYLVGLEVVLLHRETNVQPHRSREHIHACIQCVRECLLTDAGRQLGRAAIGDVVLVTEKSAKVKGKPFAFTGPSSPNALFDVAALTLHVRVFERPASS